MMNRYGGHLKLIGGSSVIFQLAKTHGITIEYRSTQDLDFDLYKFLRNERIKKEATNIVASFFI